MKNPIQIENNHCCKDSGFSINFLKWFTWGYGIISSILLIFLNLNGIFDYMDNPNSAINMWLTGGMSLLTLEHTILHQKSPTNILYGQRENFSVFQDCRVISATH